MADFKPIVCGKNNIYIPEAKCEDCLKQRDILAGAHIKALYNSDGTVTIIADLDNYYTKAQTDALLDNKVDKVAGKGLSSNDYTDAEKDKLASLKNYTAGDNISISSDGRISANVTPLTKANILSALGYKETTITMTDTGGNTVTETVLVKA